MGHFVLNDFDAIVRRGEMVALAIDALRRCLLKRAGFREIVRKFATI